MNIKNLMRRGLLGLACLFCCASISPIAKNAGTANYGKYEICIKTGSDIGDGFEGDVFITIIGDKGKTSEINYFDNDEKTLTLATLIFLMIRMLMLEILRKLIYVLKQKMNGNVNI